MNLKPQNGLMIFKNIRYGKYPFQGEIDLLLIDPVDKIIYVFEEKESSDKGRKSKANKQLKKAKAWLTQVFEEEYKIETYRMLCGMAKERHLKPHSWYPSKSYFSQELLDFRRRVLL